MLAAVHSLSNASQFEVYIKPGDYARVDLSRLVEQLQNGMLVQLGWSDVFRGDAQRLD